jgi:AI-2E family transporter
VRAQLLVCLFYGITFGIGLGLLCMPYAFALGLPAAILELIPYVGGAIVTAIAMLVALSISAWLTLGVLVVYMAGLRRLQAAARRAILRRNHRTARATYPGPDMFRQPRPFHGMR